MVVDELIQDHLTEIAQKIAVIVLASMPSIKESVRMLQAGAADYLALPTETGDLLASIERATSYPKNPKSTVLDQGRDDRLLRGNENSAQAHKQGWPN